MNTNTLGFGSGNGSALSRPGPADESSGLAIFLFSFFIAILFFYIGRNYDRLQQRLQETKTLNRASKVSRAFIFLLLSHSTSSTQNIRK